jgi:signal transduction histidine kinase
MRLLPRRLYTRIYLSTLGVLLLVTLVVGAVFHGAARPVLLHGPAERMARRVAARVSARLHEPGQRAALVRELADELAVDVTLRDAEGRLLEAAGPELPPLSPRELAAVRRGPMILHVRGPRGLIAAAPLFEPGAPGGPLRGVLEVSLLQRALVPSPWRPVALTALVLLLVAVLTLPLSRRISRPVERLTEANRRFGAGELDYRIPEGCEPRDDELHTLLRSWNDMAAQVEALVHSQKELLANVSHELRSPLSRIRVALALLPEDATVAARLRDVEVDLGELERLIDDVLTTSRLEARLPLRRTEVAARPLLSALAERAGAGVRLAEGPDPILLADGGLLRRALWNVLENALKYGAPPITLSATLDGEDVLFSICDEGPGLSMTEREQALLPFYRGDKARTPGGPGGFGLGLTLARRVAEVHGGAVSLSPARIEDGREIGLCVTLRVPVGL